MKTYVLSRTPLGFRFCAAVVIATALPFLLLGSSRRWFGAASKARTRQAPEIIVDKQPTDPFVLTVENQELLDPRTPIIQVKLTNTHVKTIRAYAIRYDITLDGGSQFRGGLECQISTSESSLVPPGETAATDVGGGTFSNPASSITLSVDYLEFTDNTSWGPDTANTRERLAGMRQGARSARRHLTRLLRTSGSDSVIKAIEGDGDGIETPSNQSEHFSKGFREGIALIKGQLKTAITSDSPSSLELAITKRFEILER